MPATFSCIYCDSPTVNVSTPIHAAAIVSCGSCLKHLMTWAQYQEIVEMAIGHDDNPPSCDLFGRDRRLTGRMATANWPFRYTDL